MYGHCKRVCTESWLWEKNPLPHRGIEPSSATCRSDDLPSELHQHLLLFPLLIFFFFHKWLIYLFTYLFIDFLSCVRSNCLSTFLVCVFCCFLLSLCVCMCVCGGGAGHFTIVVFLAFSSNMLCVRRQKVRRQTAVVARMKIVDRADTLLWEPFSDILRL